MIKKMCIYIDINTDQDTPQDVKDLIVDVMEEVNGNCFAIKSITIDGVENFNVEKGFMNEMRE